MPPPKVFISYSHKDEAWKDHLVSHLGVLEEQGLLQTWDDRRIGAGQEWIEEIRTAMNEAQVAVFLVSRHSLTSKFILHKEIPHLLERRTQEGVTVIPVIIGSCAWTKVGWLVQLQVRPRDGKALANFRGEGRDRELTRIVEEILSLVESPVAPSNSLPTGEKPKNRKSASTAPRLHNLPYRPLGPLFKGRNEELQRLVTGQEGDGGATAIVQQQVICGLGGIGKTRLVVEYTWRQGHRYTAALFVRADSRASLHAGLAALARADLLNLPERLAKAEDETVAAVLRWLRENPGWLLILDNVDTEEAALAVNEILPRLETGHVLLTSRRREWPPEIQTESLATLAREEARQFLLDRTAKGRTPAPDDLEQALQLAEGLDGLPLALEQAAAYIVHHQMSFAGYLESWQRESEDVLSWYDLAVMKYPASLAATWQKTFHHLSPTASAILRLSAFLAPDPIPQEMFERGEASARQPVKNAFAELAAYSMITRRNKTFTVHRMVQEVVRSRTPENERHEWIARALRLVDNFAPRNADDVRTWPVWDPLRPHVARVLKHADRVGLTDHPATRLLNDLGFLLQAKGLYAEAEPLMRRALEIGTASLSEKDPNFGILLNNLALLLQDTNRLAEAEPLMRRALEIDEDFFGPKHSRVAIRLNNLALVLQRTSRLAEAESLMRRALEIDEDSVGPELSRTAIYLNTLAGLLRDTNRLEEAEPLVRRALKIDEDSFGPEHPDVARDLNNLAQFLQDTNRPAEAEPLFRRSLKINEDFFGPKHPSLIPNLNNLAQVLQETNRLAEAEPLMGRALAIAEGCFGSGHPTVALLLHNLGRLLQAADRLTEAEPLMRRALDILQGSLGQDHPQTRTARRNLELLLADMEGSGEPV